MLAFKLLAVAARVRGLARSEAASLGFRRRRDWQRYEVRFVASVCVRGWMCGPSEALCGEMFHVKHSKWGT